MFIEELKVVYAQHWSENAGAMHGMHGETEVVLLCQRFDIHVCALSYGLHTIQRLRWERHPRGTE